MPWNTIAFLASWFLLACPAQAGQASSAQPRSQYNNAVARIQSGDIQGGCQAALRLAQEHPGFFAVHNLLGMCAARRGDAQEAELHFRRCIELNPNFREARNNLAIQLVRQGRADAAMEQFSKVLKADPKNVTTLFNLGRLHLAGKNSRKAAEFLRQANHLSPQDLTITLSLVEALLSMGERQPAADFLDRLIQQGQDPAHLLPASLLALRAGLEDSANRALRKAVTKGAGIEKQLLTLARSAVEKQEYRVAHALLSAFEPPADLTAEWNALAGYTDYKLGNPARSLPRLRQAVELEPTVEEYWLKLGEMLLFYRSFEVAAAVFESGLKELPSAESLHFSLAVAYLALGSHEKAERHLKTSLKLRPDFEPTFSVLCRAYHQQKNLISLRETTAEWLRLDPKSYEAFYYQGLALMEGVGGESEQRVYEQAQLLFENSIELNPRHAESHLALGKLLVNMNQIPGAIGRLEQARELDPEDPAAYYQLALAYRKAGEPTKSRNALEQFKQKRVQEQPWEFVFRVGK